MSWHVLEYCLNLFHSSNIVFLAANYSALQNLEINPQNDKLLYNVHPKLNFKAMYLPSLCTARLKLYDFFTWAGTVSNGQGQIL